MSVTTAAVILCLSAVILLCQFRSADSLTLPATYDASDFEGDSNFDGLDEEKRGKSWQGSNGLWGKRAWNSANGLWGKRGNWNSGNGVWGKRASWSRGNGVWGKRAWLNSNGMFGKRAGIIRDYSSGLVVEWSGMWKVSALLICCFLVTHAYVERKVKFGSLRLCPPGGRAFSMAWRLACEMRRKKRHTVGKDKGKWRAPTMTEIQDICCKFGCEIRDLLAYCDPFGDFNS